MTLRKIATIAACFLAGAAGLSDTAVAGTPIGGFTGRSNNIALGGYEISIQYIELCQSGSSVSNCVGGATIGTGTKAFDIASTAVGQEVDSYADTGGLPIGKTYSYIRIALSPQLTLTSASIGNVGDDGANNDSAQRCMTQTANNNTIPTTTGGGANYVNGNESPQVMTVPYARDDGGPASSPNTAGYAAINLYRPSASPNTMFYLATLTNPYTVGQSEPVIELSIDTVGAMAAWNNGGGDCQFLYPLPPQISVTVSDP